ncbi:uncharacterized protein [Lepeophtheirus salmonis]|uniref:uncharacterized protein n=1 Tax=Lepeophtheirus salmonis TaxID=72036 RepID=UPI001AE16E66|nr:achaete-scute complex protein T4-like [Lepeophtheirus salmonis]XP_040564039.1 achaete-scute complex protein T4-like [Lepeophtheirus salmonis]
MSLAVMNNNNQVKNRKHPLSEQQQQLGELLPPPVTSSANKRKLSAYHPTLGYAIPPPQPAKVARRNARERNRVKQVNCGFEVLRTHIPTAVKHKKMSKVDTLRHAVDYIQNLKQLLGEQDDLPSSPSPCSENNMESLDIKRSPILHVPTPPTPPEQLTPPPQSHMTQIPSGRDQHTLHHNNSSHQHHSTSSYYNHQHSNPHSHHDSYSQYNSISSHHIHAQHYDSGYETSSYYSSSLPSSGVSPPPHPPTSGGSSYPPPYNSLVRDGSASPSSPSVYSDYGSCSQLPNNSNVNTSSNNNGNNHGFTTLDDFYNAEEDEILDAIVKWQED